MDTASAVVTIAVTAIVVGIPLLGLTIRLSVKPLVEAWTRLREGQPASASAELEGLKLRVAALEAVFESPELFRASASERRALEGRPLGRLTDKS